MAIVSRTLGCFSDNYFEKQWHLIFKGRLLLTHQDWLKGFFGENTEFLRSTLVFIKRDYRRKEGVKTGLNVSKIVDGDCDFSILLQTHNSINIIIYISLHRIRGGLHLRNIQLIQGVIHITDTVKYRGIINKVPMFHFYPIMYRKFIWNLDSTWKISYISLELKWKNLQTAQIKEMLINSHC